MVHVPCSTFPQRYADEDKVDDGSEDEIEDKLEDDLDECVPLPLCVVYSGIALLVPEGFSAKSPCRASSDGPRGGVCYAIERRFSNFDWSL